MNELYIENFAIIDSLRISFSPGLTVMSGETGAGKSIIVGAVNLLLGDRVSNDVVRSSAESAVVEAQFDIASNRDVKRRLEELDLYDGDELVIRRTISRSGRNRITVNGRLVTAAILASIGEFLVNICGQHAHQLLVRNENHIDILDEFAGLEEERGFYGARFAEYQSLLQKLEKLKAAGRDRAEREELFRFQMNEIEAANLNPGEDQDLADEKRILMNAEKLRNLARDSYETLYEGEDALLGGLDRVRAMIAEIKSLDTGLSIDEAFMDTLYFGLEDAALSLRDYLGGLNHDPRRLEEIDERLELIGTLKRKYGGSVKAVLERGKKIAEELESIDRLEGNLEALERDIAAMKAELESLADSLSRRRREAAMVLERAVMDELEDLRMPKASFEVRFIEGESEGGETMPLHGKGRDVVEFYLSANPGEGLKPLSKVASGGELSRIVLALKKVLVHDTTAETVIFDEVDSGIGGAAAEVVGSKLRDISSRHQVICITHHPQIASFGTTHYLVTKGVDGDRTSTGVSLLGDDERVEEIARMLGGVELTDKTLDHAREMLRMSQGGRL